MDEEFRDPESLLGNSFDMLEGPAQGQDSQSTKFSYLLPNADLLILTITTKKSNGERLLLAISHPSHTYEKRMKEQLIELCSWVGPRQRNHCFVVEEREVDVLVVLRTYIYPELEKVIEPFPGYVDKLIRDFLRREDFFGDHPAQPFELTPGNEFILIAIRDVIRTLQLSAYRLTCEFGQTQLKSSFNFYQDEKRYMSNRLMITDLPKTRQIEVYFQYRGKEKISQNVLTELGFTQKGGKVVKGKLRVGRKTPYELSLLETTLVCLETYLQCIAALVEKGKIVSQSFPSKPADFAVSDLTFDSLKRQLSVVNTKYQYGVEGWNFQPPDFGFRGFIEIAYGKERDYRTAEYNYKSVLTELRFKVPHLMFQAMVFLPDKLRIITDTSELLRISALPDSHYKLPDLSRCVIDLINVVKYAQQYGYGIDKIKRSWYVTPHSLKPVVVPQVVDTKFSVCRSLLCMAATYVFPYLRIVPVFNRKLGIESIINLLTPITTRTEYKSPKAVEIARAQDETTEVLSLAKVLEKVYWEVIIRGEIWTLQEVEINNIAAKLLRTLSSSTLLITRRPRKKYESVTIKNMPLEDIRRILKETANVLIKAHKAGITHLMLSPKRVHYDLFSRNVVLTGFKLGLYGIYQKFIKLHPELDSDPMRHLELDFIDPNVLSFIYWSRKKNEDSTETAERKRKKYKVLINASSDVYSFGMLFFYCLCSTSDPFDYVKCDGFEPFFLKVVKEHRRPLIPEVFETSCPQFTDTLRRCFMKASSRPSIEEIADFIDEFVFLYEKMQDAFKRRNSPFS